MKPVLTDLSRGSNSLNSASVLEYSKLNLDRKKYQLILGNSYLSLKGLLSEFKKNSLEKCPIHKVTSKGTEFLPQTQIFNP